MSWSKLYEDEPELYYRSNAHDQQGIYQDLNIVFKRMLDRRTEDGADQARQLLFLVNATNGFIDIYWYDHENQRSVGIWLYQLKLKSFCEITKGNFFFDEECYRAIYNLAKNYAYNSENIQQFRIFAKFELGGFVEIKL
jgi:hypothetical protein